MKFFLITALVFCLFPLFAEASPEKNSKQNVEVTILGPQYPGYIEANETGAYQKLVHTAVDSHGIIVKEEILPIKRALISFLNHGGDCIYSMAKPVLSAIDKNHLVKSLTLNNVKLFIFSKKGSPPVVALKQIPKDKAIGGVLGYEDYYQEAVKKGYTIEYVQQDFQNIEKLRRDYVSYIYGTFPNMDPYRSELSYDESRPLMVVPDAIFCYKNERTEKFIAVFNDNAKGALEKKLSIERNENRLVKEKQKQLLLRDLLADILPPPLFIIESHLISLELLQEAMQAKPDQALLESLITRASQLHIGGVPNRVDAGFDERVLFWEKNLKSEEEKKIWNMYSNSALVSAKEYFNIQEKEFFPAIRAHNLILARDILEKKLLGTYSYHRNQIDSIVAESLKIESALKNNPEKLSVVKDFVIDILPPPLYLVESFLVAERLVTEAAFHPAEEERVSALLTENQLLLGSGNYEVYDSASYAQRLAYWKNIFTTSLKDEKVLFKDFLDTVTPEKNYEKAFDDIFVKLIHQKKWDEARLHVKKTLMPLFEAHRMEIEDLSRKIRQKITIVATKE